MDRRERSPTQEELLRMVLDSLQTRMWSAVPGIIQSVAENGQSCHVQPVWTLKFTQKDGTVSDVQMPLLQDCPIQWLGGGGVTVTVPVAKDDECLVILCNRSIDDWWSQGGVQTPTAIQMHNLSDGFCLPGVRSQPRAFDVDLTQAQIRSDDGTTVFSLNPTAKTISGTAQGGITLNGVTIDSSGNLHSPATITGATDVKTGSGISLQNHTHTDPQGGTVGPPQG